MEALLVLTLDHDGADPFLTSATEPREMGRPPSPMTKSLHRSSDDDLKGSSSCTTTLYWLPVRGSVKIDLDLSQTKLGFGGVR